VGIEDQQLVTASYSVVVYESNNDISVISANLGYLIDMTANNSLKIMLLPDEVQDTGPPEPF